MNPNPGTQGTGVSGLSGAVKIGTASWAIPAVLRGAFPEGGSTLARYAVRFGAVEINSSFHRAHKPGTYARWAGNVPERFRFAVKVPKAITHERRMLEPQALLDDFLGQVNTLGPKLGPLLVQLPPSLAFEPRTASGFFDEFRARFAGALACEPRHADWFHPEADDLLARYRVARVAANPATVARAAVPGGWTELSYFRLHGSPKTYYSSYSAEFLAQVSEHLGVATAGESWCIFDNTALGAAAANALELQALMSAGAAHLI